MSTVNWTWVCFDCRAAFRRLKGGNYDVRCACCAKPCECLGAAKRLPRKSDIKAWDALRETYYGALRKKIFALESERRKHIGDVRRNIKVCSRMPRTKERDAYIIESKRYLEELLNREHPPRLRLSCDMGV